MSFYGITADYNGPLKEVNAHTDDDRYDMVELGACWPAQMGPLRSATRMQHCFCESNPSVELSISVAEVSHTSKVS